MWKRKLHNFITIISIVTLTIRGVSWCDGLRALYKSQLCHLNRAAVRWLSHLHHFCICLACKPTMHAPFWDARNIPTLHNPPICYQWIVSLWPFYISFFIEEFQLKKSFYANACRCGTIRTNPHSHTHTYTHIPKHISQTARLVLVVSRTTFLPGSVRCCEPFSTTYVSNPFCISMCSLVSRVFATFLSVAMGDVVAKDDLALPSFAIVHGWMLGCLSLRLIVLMEPPYRRPVIT